MRDTASLPIRTAPSFSVTWAILRCEMPCGHISSSASSTSPVARWYSPNTCVVNVPSRSRGTRNCSILPTGVMRLLWLEPLRSPVRVSVRVSVRSRCRAPRCSVTSSSMTCPRTAFTAARTRSLTAVRVRSATSSLAVPVSLSASGATNPQNTRRYTPRTWSRRGCPRTTSSSASNRRSGATTPSSPSPDRCQACYGTESPQRDAPRALAVRFAVR